MFFASVDLDPVKAKLQFNDIANDVIMLFTKKPNVNVKIVIEIQAECEAGFDQALQRSVLENCDQLKIKKRDFDD